MVDLKHAAISLRPKIKEFLTIAGVVPAEYPIFARQACPYG